MVMSSTSLDCNIRMEKRLLRYMLSEKQPDKLTQALESVRR